jgi:hypothetical protein
VYEFLKNNPSVANVYWQRNNRLIVQLKNGEKEEYDLNSQNIKKSFTEKYGIMPLCPPPPPPPLEKMHDP